jgi:hypothetical protein
LRFQFGGHIVAKDIGEPHGSGTAALKPEG